MSTAATLPEHTAPRSAGPSVAALFAAHGDFVWRTLRRLGVPEASTDDAAQQVFLVASRKLDVIETGNERGFLFGISSNVAAHARRSVKRSREVAEDVGVEPVDPGPSPHDALEDRDARALLDEVLDTLDTDLRETFVLFELEEMTMADIARALEIPPGTVASRLRRAREAFRVAAARLRAAPRRGGRR